MSTFVAPIVAAGIAAVLLSPAHAQQPTRVLDRTFSCETGYQGGAYEATVSSYWFVPPQSERRIPSATVATRVVNGSLAGISSISLSVNRVRCQATRTPVRLTTRGLQGGAFSSTGASFECFTPRRVLVRIRATFMRPTALTPSSRYGFPQLEARGEITRAELALATFTGKPLAYASIAGTAKGRLFTTGDCIPE